MTNIAREIQKYDREFIKGSIHYTNITLAARNYLTFSQEVDGVDRKLDPITTGFRRIKSVKLRITDPKGTVVVWNFDTVEGTFGRPKTGCLVSSWRDCLKTFVSKEDGNTVFLMIMEKAKATHGAKVEMTVWKAE